jgi:hypothetical protein
LLRRVVDKTILFYYFVNSKAKIKMPPAYPSEITAKEMRRVVQGKRNIGNLSGKIS